MSQTIKILQNFGLSENEISVYLESLKHENVTPYTISKLTKIPRTTVYDVLLNLSLKGLVELQSGDGFTKMQTLVRAKNPSILRKILQKKRSDLLKIETDIIGILPGLKSEFHGEDPNADFQFYGGMEKFKKFYLEQRAILSEVDVQWYTWDMLMPADVIGSDLMNKVVDIQNKSRQSFKYKPKEIVPLTDWSRHVLSYQCTRDPDYLKYREIRYIDNPAFDLSVEMNVVGNKVLVACAVEDEVWALAINSKALSDSMKAIFQVQWLSAVPVTRELVKSWGASEMLKGQKR